MSNVEERCKQAGRRTLLKAGGFVAASGALGSIWAMVTGVATGRNPQKRARWIKVVDRPTLSETSADYKRFSALRKKLENRSFGGDFEIQ
jgi:hypothetical protein